jgi:transcriptional regulator with XRE-family HTH domain
MRVSIRYSIMRVKPKPDTAAPLASRLQLLLSEKGWSQADLARRSKLGTGHIAMLVTGKLQGKRLNLKTAVALGQAFRKPPSYFLTSETQSGE